MSIILFTVFLLHNNWSIDLESKSGHPAYKERLMPLDQMVIGYCLLVKISFCEQPFVKLMQLDRECIFNIWNLDMYDRTCNVYLKFFSFHNMYLDITAYFHNVIQ